MGYVKVVTLTVIYIMFNIWAMNFKTTVTGKRYHINFKIDCNGIHMIYPLICKDLERSILGPLSQSFVCDLTNINWTLNFMVKESENLNKKN